MNNDGKLIVLYDGDCGFCNRVVQFILKYEKDSTVKFSSLESSYASKLFDELGLVNPDKSTFYFFDGKQMYSRSSAAVELSMYLKFPLSMMRLIKILPMNLRDGAYNFIAKRRRRISKNYCFVPSQDIRNRFLD